MIGYKKKNVFKNWIKLIKGFNLQQKKALFFYEKSKVLHFFFRFITVERMKIIMLLAQRNILIEYQVEASFV